jgi:undecaprenyl-diphosphatase
MHDGLPVAVERRLNPLQRYELRLTLFALAVLLVALPFGTLLGQVITDGPATKWDSDIAERLHELVAGEDAVVAALEVLSFLGKPIWLFFVIGLPCLWLAHHRHWHLVAFLTITAIGGGIIDTIVKVVVARPRPLLDDPVSSARGHSFPSGHTMSATVCYGALLLTFAAVMSDDTRKRLIVATLTLVAAIGVSRLALGVHYVTDVAGGFVLGLAWLCASVAAWEIWREDRGLRRTRPIAEGIEPEEAEEAAQDPVP